MSGEKLSEKAKVRSVFDSLLIVSRAIPKTISRQVEYQIVVLHKVTIACMNIWQQFGCCLEAWTKLQLLQQIILEPSVSCRTARHVSYKISDQLKVGCAVMHVT